VEGRCPPILGSMEKCRAANQKASRRAQNDSTAPRERLGEDRESTATKLSEPVCKVAIARLFLPIIKPGF
jgi:hypothetical protein